MTPVFVFVKEENERQEERDFRLKVSKYAVRKEKGTSLVLQKVNETFR